MQQFLNVTLTGLSQGAIYAAFALALVLIWRSTRIVNFAQGSMGPDPTREGLVAAVEQSGAQMEGPWLAPYRYSEQSHAGISGVKVSRIVGTGTEDLTPVQTTDNGEVPITPYPGPPSTPPPNGIPVPPAG